MDVVVGGRGDETEMEGDRSWSLILVHEGAVTQHFYTVGGCINSHGLLESNLATFNSLITFILFDFECSLEI